MKPDARLRIYQTKVSAIPSYQRLSRISGLSSGHPVGGPFQVTSFRSPRFALTSHTVQMDIAVTSTHLLLPMSESRSDVWMLDAIDR